VLGRTQISKASHTSWRVLARSTNPYREDVGEAFFRLGITTKMLTHQEKAMRHAKAIKNLPTQEKKREYAHVLCQYLIAILRDRNHGR
jgi:hypothetical protein